MYGYKLIDCNAKKIAGWSEELANKYYVGELSDAYDLVQVYNYLHRYDENKYGNYDFFFLKSSKSLSKSIIDGKHCYMMSFPASIWERTDVNSCVSINIITLKIEQMQFEWQTRQGQDPPIYRSATISFEDLEAISMLYLLGKTSFTFEFLRDELRSRSLRTLSDNGRKFWVVHGKEFLYGQLDKNFDKKGIKVVYVDTKELLTEQSQITELRKRMRP